MSSLTVGSLCTGYDGLELAAELALGPLDHLWYAEYDPGDPRKKPVPIEKQPAARVLAERLPGVPNIGDIQAITATSRWHELPPVDVLCAGYPCQGESAAGLRRGTDDPRFRWPDVFAAIRTLRPGLVLLENVRGHLNRSFPRVVADLAAIGYVGRWRCVRASDIGAPHRRDRLYAAAWPAGHAPTRLRGTATARPADAMSTLLLPTPKASDGEKGAGWGDQPGRPLSETIHRLPTPCAADSDRRSASYARGNPTLGGALLPTPRTTDANGAGMHGDGGPDLRTVVTALLPTPRASDTGTPGRRGGEGFRPPLSQVVFDQVPGALLPTPKASDGEKGGPDMRGSSGDPGLPAAGQENRWGQYAAAIARWEAILGRPAPEPTMTGRNGSPQLAPRFVEWMMGLPAGWVTDIIDHRGQALRVLGNGIVPQAAAHAYSLILAEPEQPGLFEVGLTGATT